MPVAKLGVQWGMMLALLCGSLGMLATAMGRARPKAVLAYVGDDSIIDWMYVMDVDTTASLYGPRRTHCSMSWSPEGQFLALSEYNIVTGEADISLASLQPVLAPRQLTSQSGYNFSPTWSPDGQQIAFLSRRGGQLAIHLIDVGSGDRTRLVSVPTNASRLSWSPAGGYLAFEVSSQDTPEPSSIYLVTLETAHIEYLANGRLAAWSPDGESLAYQDNRVSSLDLYLMDIPARVERPLTNTQAAVKYPSWSPDGRYIAFVYLPDWATIGLLDIDSSSLRYLPVPQLTEIEAPLAWSPDGTRLAFSARNTRTLSGWDMDAPFDLYVITVDGTHLYRVRTGYRLPNSIGYSHFCAIAWRP